MPVRLDDARFPLVEIVFEPPVERADLDVFEAKCREWLARRQRHVTVFDARAMAGLGADKRRRIAQIAAELGDDSKRWVVCTCLVITNPLVRGLVTAVNWITPPPVAQHVFADRDLAIAYAEQRLAAERHSTSVDDA